MPLAPFEKLNPRKKKYLLAAAEGEFARLPYDRVSVFEIARSAGISRSSFYYYFSDKEDLYHYLLSQIRDELLDSLPREIDLEDFPTLLLDFFAARRDTERGPFIARLLERAQMWSQDGFASMRPPVPPARDRIRNLEQIEPGRSPPICSLRVFCSGSAAATVWAPTTAGRSPCRSCIWG